MENMAREFGDEAHFLFVYVREAHPGELYPHHTSFVQKAGQARDMRKHGVGRPILVDSLNGDVHRQYGGMPNMSWIIDHTGRVSFKASWTVAFDIQAALEETLELKGLRRQGGFVAPYYRETMGLKVMPAEEVYLGGEKAYEDVRKVRERDAARGK